jgi:hypothetical protein
MDPNRRKKASLAINTILRGLEFDQLVFHYDETARPDITSLAGRRLVVASEARGELIATSPSLLLELPPLTRTTTAA